MRGSTLGRGAFPAGVVGLAVAAAAMAVLATSLPDAPSLDVLACIRFYLAYGCPP